MIERWRRNERWRRERKRGGSVSYFESACGAVGEAGNGVVYGHVSVDGDAVEEFVHCGSEAEVGCARGYGCVCEKECRGGLPYSFLRFWIMLARV